MKRGTRFAASGSKFHFSPNYISFVSVYYFRLFCLISLSLHNRNSRSDVQLQDEDVKVQGHRKPRTDLEALTVLHSRPHESISYVFTFIQLRLTIRPNFRFSFGSYKNRLDSTRNIDIEIMSVRPFVCPSRPCILSKYHRTFFSVW